MFAFILNIASILLILLASMIFTARTGYYNYNIQLEREIIQALKSMPIGMHDIKTVMNVSCLLYCYSSFLFGLRKKIEKHKLILYLCSFGLITCLFLHWNSTACWEKIYLMKYKGSLKRAEYLQFLLSLANCMAIFGATLVSKLELLKEYRTARIFVRKFQIKIHMVISILLSAMFLVVLHITVGKNYLIQYADFMHHWIIGEKGEFNSIWLIGAILVLVLIFLVVILKFNTISDTLYKLCNPNFNKNLLLTKDVQHVFHSYKNGLLSIKLLVKKAEEHRGEEAELEALREIAAKVDDFTFKAKQFTEIYKKTVLQYDVVSAKECVEEACSQFTVPSNIHLEKKFSTEKDIFYGDSALIAESINNLLHNAVDAISRRLKNDGKITVEVWSEKELIAISVRDNGIGIPKNSMKKIFDPLFSTKNSAKNWGIGLCYVKTVAIAHEGSISVKSKEGEWTEFQLVLPMDI